MQLRAIDVYRFSNIPRDNMDMDKFMAIVSYVRDHLDVTPEEIEDFISGGPEGWAEPDHYAWLTATSPCIIAHWVIAGLR